MDSAIHLLSNWPQVVRVKNLLPWFPVPLAGSRGMRTTLRRRRRQGRGREGKGWGDWEKSPHGKNTEKVYTKMKNNWKKKTRTKQRVSNIFPIFSLQNKPFFQSAPVEDLLQYQANARSSCKCIFSREDKALSSLDILQFIWTSLLFFLPWVFKNFTKWRITQDSALLTGQFFAVSTILSLWFALKLIFLPRGCVPFGQRQE